MATPTLTDEKLAQGRLLYAQLAEEGVPLDAAFWAYSSAIGEWRLFLLTSAVDTQGPRKLLRRAREIMKRLNGTASLELFDIDFESPFSPEMITLLSNVYVGRGSEGTVLENVRLDGFGYEELRPYFIDPPSFHEEPAPALSTH